MTERLRRSRTRVLSLELRRATVIHVELPGWAHVVDLNDDGSVRSLLVTPLRCINGAGNLKAPKGFWTTRTEDRSLTTRHLRRIALGEIASAATRAISSVSMAFGLDFAPNPFPDFAERPGRAGRSDREYALVAEQYTRVLAMGDETPVVTLAAQLFLSPSQVRNVLHEARRRELLTASPRGRPGGALTEKAHRALEGGADSWLT